MFVIVAVDFSVAFKTDWYGVLDAVVVAFSSRVKMVNLDFRSTKPVANATSTVTLYEKLVNFSTGESIRHGLSS